jgi:hypothetical protein
LSTIWRLISRGVQRVGTNEAAGVDLPHEGGRGDIAFPGRHAYNQPPTLFFAEHSRARVLRTRVRFAGKAGRPALQRTMIVHQKSQIDARARLAGVATSSSFPLAMTVGSSAVPAPPFSLHPDRFFDPDRPSPRRPGAVRGDAAAPPRLPPMGTSTRRLPLRGPGLPRARRRC